VKTLPTSHFQPPFAQIDHHADSIDELDVTGEAPQADV
jgi:hypothetical protein